ncbi:MAG TPA: hypothetical protein VGA01_19530 [Candidatus Binatia bacterium]
MRGRFYFWPLMGMLWFLDAGAVHGQENTGLLLSGATQDSHQMNMGDKKDGEGFQHVHALAIDGAGKAMFLGTHVGLFRSDDRGRSWKKVAMSATPSGFDMMGVSADPRDPKTIYVATHEAGVFKSIDGGETWKQVNNGLGGMDVHGLAIDPNTPQKLYAAVREKGEGVYRTTDGGGKWTRVDDGPQGEIKVLTSVNISTGMGGIFLYAGTSTGLQRSPDCF